MILDILSETREELKAINTEISELRIKIESWENQDSDKVELFNEMLDEQGEIDVLGSNYDPSYLLKKLDPMKYECDYNDYSRSIISELEDEISYLREDKKVIFKGLSKEVFYCISIPHQSGASWFQLEAEHLRDLFDDLGKLENSKELHPESFINLSFLSFLEDKHAYYIGTASELLEELEFYTGHNASSVKMCTNQLKRLIED